MIPSELPHTINIPHRRWLAFLAFFFVGFDYRLSVGSGPTLAVLELVSFIALLFWCLDLVWNQRRVLEKTIEVAGSLRWVVVYFLWAFLTIWLGFTRSVDNLFAFRNLFPGLIICFIVMTHVRDRQDVRLCLWSYSGGVLVNLAIATAQKILGYPYPNALHAGAMVKMDLEGQFITNTPSGFFVHPNGLAVFLIPAAIMFVSGRRAGMFSGWTGGFLQASFVAITLAILYLTYAKGALLWVGLGLLICFSPAFLKRRITLLSGCVLAIIPIILFLGTDPFKLGFRTMNSMITRFEIWGAALKTMQTDPYVLAFGNGFQSIYRQTLRMSELPYLNAHNNILNQIIFFGLPALAFYLMAFWTMLRAAAVANRNIAHDHLLVSLVASVVALVGEHFFEPVLDSVALQAQYYAFLALVMALSQMQEVNPRIPK